MSSSLRSPLRRWMHQAIRAAVSHLPRAMRFRLFRAMVQCDPAPDARLVLKIAETQDELEACFALLHDAYVCAGFMKPHASGLRVTPYHALPTTTTLCAKFDGRVVGTLSLIRNGVFGFPMQSTFDLGAIAHRPGQIAEVSALAVHAEFRRTGGWILFPLMKFMYEYATRYFDTRHIVIAVNPDKIELYESLMFFERLPAAEVDSYDFANGAPAVGAVLDIAQAKETFQRTYANCSAKRDLYRYFVETELPNIQQPARPYHTTNDPVLTPSLLHHFFNRRTSAFQELDDRRRMLLRSIYDLSAYESVLPAVNCPEAVALRRHPRYTMSFPARFTPNPDLGLASVAMKVVEISRGGFRAASAHALPIGTQGALQVELGLGRVSTVLAVSVRQVDGDDPRQFGFRVDEPDSAWLACVEALEAGQTHADLKEGSEPQAAGEPRRPHVNANTPRPSAEALALQH